MRIRRLRVSLPAHMKDTAHHDARQIAQAIALAVHANGGQGANIELNAHGQSSAVLAQRVSAALPKGDRHGG